MGNTHHFFYVRSDFIGGGTANEMSAINLDEIATFLFDLSDFAQIMLMIFFF